MTRRSGDYRGYSAWRLQARPIQRVFLLCWWLLKLYWQMLVWLYLGVRWVVVWALAKSRS